MKKLIALGSLSLALLAASTGVLASEEYNKVPAGDRQYAQCLSYVNRIYTGGTDKSPIPRQNKSQAWCTCMWNETPDNFRGNLAVFGESKKGKETNAICEKYADWGN